jgi:Ser/Thr protein kinase RdoA (MazF antagonist)
MRCERPDGSLSLTVTAGELALLDHVEGRLPDLRASDDLRRVGAALARAHARLAGDLDAVDPALVWPWPWAEEAVARIPMATDLRDGVRHVRGDARRLVARAHLPIAVVHGDPTRDAFLLHPADPEQDGIIDWSATLGAPAVYDLGTVAAVHAEEPGVVDGILRGYADVDRGIAGQLPLLPILTRLRWMCTALYFADRIARGIVRGGSAESNQHGLTRATAGLAARTGSP